MNPRIRYYGWSALSIESDAGTLFFDPFFREYCGARWYGLEDFAHANVVCVTRPTVSALRYEQMVGRGLRGPKNGGTRRCLVLDVQDEGLPEGIQSYQRVRHQWQKKRRHA